MSKNISIKTNAFTIVELLVVIVVVGILAAISIVAYSGISQKAIVASLQSDLSYAQTQLKLFKVDNTAFPNSITSCPVPTTGNLCLKLSPGNAFSSYSANNTTNPQTYSMSIMRDNVIYTVTNTTLPTTLASAPLSPVADWLAMAQGDHYGNYYDLVGNQWATVSRAGAKTIYDPTTNHIYDVPANKLGINPRVDQKNGSEATVELSRTNYLLNSYFDTDSNSDGLSDNWSLSTGGYSTNSYSRNTTSPIYGTIQKVRITRNNGTPTGYPTFQQLTAPGTFSPGDLLTGGIWYRNLEKGGSNPVILNCRGYNSTASTQYNQNYVSLVVGDPNWRFASVTATLSDVNVARGGWSIQQTQNTDGDYFEIEVATAQIEKGSTATSFIPTTTTAVTRNADVVTVQSNGWDSNNGTFFVVAEPATSGRYISWIGATTAHSLYRASGNQIQGVIGGAPTYTAAKVGTFVSTAAMTWANGGSLYGYMDGLPSVATPGITTSPLNATVNIGGYAGYDYINGAMQRVIVYNTALSSADITTLTNAVKNGP